MKNKSQVLKLINKLKNMGVSNKAIAKSMDISQPTFYSRLKKDNFRKGEVALLNLFSNQLKNN